MSQVLGQIMYVCYLGFRFYTYCEAVESICFIFEYYLFGILFSFFILVI